MPVKLSSIKSMACGFIAFEIGFFTFDLHIDGATTAAKLVHEVLDGVNV